MSDAEKEMAAHIHALILAANSAKNYILEHGDERTMAPIVEQLERAIAGTP